MKIAFTLILTCLSIFNLNSQTLTNWLGTYKYEEKPAKTLSGTLYMTMTWDLEVLKGKKEYYAILKINGEQTEITIRAIVEGEKDKATFLFDRGINGFGFEYLKKKDRLFEFKRINGKLITNWDNFEPRLREEYINDTFCFKKL